MAKKRFVTEKRYEVDWYRNGFCYRTTTNVTWEGVKDMKKIAKLLGETISYDHVTTKKYEY